MIRDYSPPGILFNAHLETIYPSLFRKVDGLTPARERIATPDDDFLDIDWFRHTTKAIISDEERDLVIVSHGLEGNSSRGYVLGMARAFYNHGLDVLAWNYRGCSGELNRQRKFYHSGASDDLACVVSHAANQLKYKKIYLIGFSLGGNITLKYLGENAGKLPQEVSKAVVFSVPMDLAASASKISQRANWIYSERFIRHLKVKIQAKAAVRKDIDITGIDDIKTLPVFDDRYTAPMNGFRDAAHYYAENSATRFVKQITIPALIVNALNDPFLTPECSPAALLQNHPAVILENPLRGGHVGFTLFKSNGLYWSELRALDFILS